MERHLKSYQVILCTAGPIFIGNGKEIGKKEYVFLNKGKVGIPDIQRFYQELSKRGKARAFEEYLLGYGRNDLTNWLRKQKIKTDEIRPFLKYTLDCADAVIERNTTLHVMECIKDAYGSPYVPGSSLKGMFRTILLGCDIIHHPQKYAAHKEQLKRNAATKAERRTYLSKDIFDIENTAYRTLKREGTKPQDAVNDCLQGLIVSDSEPLPVSSLILCQKVELHTDGTEKMLPMLRECIRPDTEICFTVTIDTSVCQVSVRSLMEAVKNFMDSYYNCFASSFPNVKKPKENDVLLGGGCGFVSKTAVYPLFGKKEGLEISQKIFKVTLNKNFWVHKHDKDNAYGASPYILKCTKYHGKTVQMGLCRIKKIYKPF